MGTLGILTMFSASGNQKLTTKKHIVAYLIKFYFANPGWTDSHFEKDMISFRKTNAMYGEDPSAMASQIETDLSSAIGRYFDSDVPVVTVEYSNLQPNGDYTISILVADQLGIPVLSMDDIKIDADGNIIANFDILDAQ